MPDCRVLLSLVLLTMPVMSPAAEGEWSGYISAEWRIFPDEPLDEAQHGDNLSLSFQPEYYREWQNGKQSFRFTPYIRIDGHDKKRSHVDVRELNWTYVGKDTEVLAGIGKVYWGVTESQHLVDIINQTDLVDNPDGEDKLGQPMLKFSFVPEWGDVDLFVLPGFRERTFHSRKGRLRSALPVATADADYADNTGRDHVDFAIRWSKAIGDWDVGFSHFSGTSRDPRFRQSNDSAGRPVLIPVYETIDQTGVDIQATKGDWLWKLEVISRSGQGRRYTASTGGFEYTLYGVFDSAADIGLITEYLYDDRGRASPNIFEDDLFIGARLTLNDAASSELLVGGILDLSNGSRVFSIEGSRRYGDNWKLSIESRFFVNIARDDGLAGLRQDDFVQLELAYYF